MKFLIGVVVFVPLAILLGVFAVDNRIPVALQLWPLPGVYELWASVWVLGVLAVGILFGMTVGWLSGTGWRRRARRAENRLKKHERDASDREVSDRQASDRESAGRAVTIDAPRSATAGLLPDASRRRAAQIDD